MSAAVTFGSTDRRRVPGVIYREILWDIPLGIGVIHVEDRADLGSSRILSANPAALRMKELSPQQSIGKTLREVFPELLETKYPEVAVRVLHTGKALDLGLLKGFRHPGRTYAVKVFPLTNSCVGVLFEDVSGVQALAEAQDRFAKALLASPLAMCIIRLAGGELLDANARFLDLFGFQLGDELAGKRVRELGMWRGPREYERITADLEKRREIREVPVKCRTREGGRFRALASLALIRMEGEDCILALFWGA